MENIIEEKIQTLINIAEYAKSNLEISLPVKNEKYGLKLCKFYADMFNEANIKLQRMLQENYHFNFTQNFEGIFGC